MAPRGLNIPMKLDETPSTEQTLCDTALVSDLHDAGRVERIKSGHRNLAIVRGLV
jgi:hypothetical protein